MIQKIANKIYNIYTLIREKNTNIQVVVLGKSHGLDRPSSCETLRQV